jgi:hypothetical protein
MLNLPEDRREKKLCPSTYLGHRGRVNTAYGLTKNLKINTRVLMDAARRAGFDGWVSDHY